MFGLVPVVCLRDPDFVEAKGKLYSTSVLGSLGETEPTVVGKHWEAAIMIVPWVGLGMNYVYYSPAALEHPAGKHMICVSHYVFIETVHRIKPYASNAINSCVL